MAKFVDSEGREYVTSWGAAVSAARDWADGGEGWDLEALAGVLYGPVSFHGGQPRWYARPEVDVEAVAACDWTAWRAASAHSGGMAAERWEPGNVCHVWHLGLWRDADTGALSLRVTAVPEYGNSPYVGGAGIAYDSDRACDWGGLDWLFTNRAAWRRELAEAAALFGVAMPPAVA